MFLLSSKIKLRLPVVCIIQLFFAVGALRATPLHAPAPSAPSTTAPKTHSRFCTHNV